jgi:AcrR family transcriptional regulator
MPETASEMKKREILRLSNKESNELTRECIASALMLLIAEKEYNQIKISEIVKRAGVSRTAYYRNFESKEDILRNTLQFVISSISEATGQFSFAEEEEQYWKTLFATTKMHAKSFSALLKAGFGHSILDEIAKHKTSGVEGADEKARYEVFYRSGAIYNVLANWVKDGMKQTEGEMVRICLHISECLRRP